MVMKTKVLLAVGACAAALFGFADEWTVAQDGSGDYTTIQDAIDASTTKAGDTIWVKPGVYATGGRSTAYDTGITDYARVLVTKRLNIIATSDDPADTHIVGAADPVSAYDGRTYGGRGTNAVRCVRFDLNASDNKNAEPSIIRGFTIRDGYCRQYANNVEGGDLPAGQPGGVTSRSSNYENFYVVDCVIRNCYGVRGGLVRFGNYVRCRFEGGSGSAGQDLGRGIRMMGCLIVRPTDNCLMELSAVNTTIVDGGAPTGSGEIFYNCLTEDLTIGSDKTAGVAKNSVLAYKMSGACTDCEIGLGYQMLAPLRGDFRVRTGTVAATRGDAAHIAAIFPKAVDNAVIDLYRGMDGAYFAKEGPVPCGCHAKTATSVGGAVQYANGVRTKDYEGSTRGGLYAFSERPFELFQVMPPEGKNFFRIKRTADCGGNRFPEMDESVWETCPPDGIVSTNEVVWVSGHMYVDADHGSDETGDGSAQSPYQTLSNCVKQAKSGVNYIVHAAAGDYNKGVIEGAGMLNRVAVTGHRIRFKGAGRGKSFISGRRSDETEDGRGSDAVRCAYLASSYSCIQGFTLREGYTHDGTADTTDRKGGLVYMQSNKGRDDTVCDCELIGGVAYRGGIVMNGSLTRCIVRGCKALLGGACRQTYIESCVFYDHDFTSFSNTINADCPIVQSTIVARGFAHGQENSIRNSVVLSTGNTSGWSYMSGAKNVVYWCDTGSYGSAGDTCVKAVLNLVDPANGDCRPLTTSPAVTQGFTALDDCWKTILTDVNGVPLRISPEGQVVAGGIQTPVMAVVADLPKYGTFTSGAGTNVLEKGDSVTVTYAEDETHRRHAEAMLVNGEEIPGMSYTYTAGDPFAADGSIVPTQEITVRFSTNWYVNAETGDDFATGFTPETAWKSLTNVYTKGYVLAGDCVHAAAGDYVEGFVTVSGVGNCRAFVQSGVTLLADEGPAATRIVGARDTAGDSYGRGANAVRCVYLQSQARVVGFTLADGRVSGTGTGEGSDTCGAGICASTKFSGDANCGGAFGCVITNCVGARGAAALNGRLVNCRVLDCRGTACTPVGYYTLLVGCYIDGCKQSQWCRMGGAVYRCTFGPNNVDGSNPFEGCGKVDNCVIMCPASVNDTTAAYHYNCLIRFYAGGSWTDARKALAHGCAWYDTYAEMGLDATGHPLSRTSAPVDEGTGLQTPNVDVLLGGVDADGVQRTYNGAMDIGAFEYDWRKIYAADLGGLAKVEKADPQVVEADGKVLVKDGEIALAFAPYSGRTAKYDIPLEVTGTGTLTVKAGDAAISTYTAADGQQTLRIRDRDMGSDYVLAYEPGDADEGGALIGKITGGVPGMLLIIR